MGCCSIRIVDVVAHAVKKSRNTPEINSEENSKKALEKIYKYCGATMPIKFGIIQTIVLPVISMDVRL